MLEILSVVLYTGPMFVLYSGLLRGFGVKGAVRRTIDFWSVGLEQGFKGAVHDKTLRHYHKPDAGVSIA